MYRYMKQNNQTHHLPHTSSSSSLPQDLHPIKSLCKKLNRIIKLHLVRNIHRQPLKNGVGVGIFEQGSHCGIGCWNIITRDGLEKDGEEACLKESSTGFLWSIMSGAVDNVITNMVLVAVAVVVVGTGVEWRIMLTRG